ncbi:MAG: valine--tRNA ligase [Cyanobacteria bacterium P01_H01_bin.74]
MSLSNQSPQTQENNPPPLEKKLNAKAIEAELYAFWEKAQLFAPKQPHTETNNNSESPETFSMVIPPPNVTGVLHMGHALDNTIQDILTRWHRMRGDVTLWMPGMDHAGIATQNVVEKQLKTRNLTKSDLGREKFVEETWQWSRARQADIATQFKRLGISPDWQRQRFTLDEGLSKAVRHAFVTLYNQGLIHQDTYIVNWCPRCTSAISDIETEYQDQDSFLWEIAYPVFNETSGQNTSPEFSYNPETVAGAKTDPLSPLVVATTRPETLLGDVAIAVHPDDSRYKAYIGQKVCVPLSNRPIPVITDPYVDSSFGTGVLKITPAHDPNDFKLAQTHRLDPIWVIDETGCLKKAEQIPQALQGLERFEARKQIEACLKENKQLISKTPHHHRVGQCQRCQTVIEPLLSKQWFVKTKPLAKQCLASLEAGEIRFIPERWTKDYVRWLSKIEDWCISRQLWWGHQIPAWHCKDCQGITVSLEEPETCTHCRSNEIYQDPDVLDTWFSSGLWPFSTMGWPDTTAPDYQRFYPTSVLVTGFDIIFFWVARMTMFAHALTGQSPFETVYIHGLIRDEKGQKMSKSKGNTIDPVELIEDVGCDGFRFSLTSLITYGGQDIKLSKDKVEQGRLFTTKLWNASRFVLMNIAPTEDNPSALPQVDALPINVDRESLSLMDRWILSSYHQTIQQANELLAQFKFGEYADLLLDFTWNNFCDWYVEFAKKQLQIPALQQNTQRILRDVLTGIHQLLHPVMPFVTEAVYQKIPAGPQEKAVSISVSAFPQADTQWIDTTLTQQMAIVLNVVKALRNSRQQYGISYQMPINAMVFTDSDEERQALTAGEDIVAYFVKLDALHIQPSETDVPKNSVIQVVGQCKVVVPLDGVIDVEKERSRLKKKRDDLKKEHTDLNARLNNVGFVERAPAAVVEKNRSRLSELDKQLLALESQLNTLT